MENPTTAMLHSGGRNSIVLLHILEPYLDDILVVWCNTGAAYESTLKQMGQIRNSVPHFLELNSDQRAQIVEFGYPTDILPLRNVVRGRGDLVPALQSTDSCCAANIFAPIEHCLQEKGITKCYSGKSAPAKAIQANGVDYQFPLGRWTTEMVQEYAKKHNIIVPPYYETEQKSRDCWNCTGYLWQRGAAIRALPFYQKEEIIQRLDQIELAINQEKGWLEGITQGV